MLYARDLVARLLLLTAGRIKKRRERRSALKKPRAAAKKRDLGDPYDSVWWRFLQDPQVTDPKSRQGKLFRRRFRVPHGVFQMLVSMWRTMRCTCDKGGGPRCRCGVDALGKEKWPVELKILAVLRYIGRGECWDTSEELCRIPANTLRRFACDKDKGWLRKMGPLHKVYCTPPSSDEEIRKHLAVYEAVGLPGALCSMDAVAIYWPACPEGWRVHYKGDKGQSIGYNVSLPIVGMIMSLSPFAV